MGFRLYALLYALRAAAAIRVSRRSAAGRAEDDVADCPTTCTRYVNGASASDEFVCMNVGQGICGANDPCPNIYPKCRQQSAAPPTCAPVCPGWSPPPVPVEETQNGVAWREVTYGKYHKGDCDYSANTLTAFTKAGDNTPRPTIIDIHGGGFTGGTNKKSLDGQVQAYTDRGFTFISMTYRTVATKYFYTACNGDSMEEEFIAVSPDGVMSIPNASRAMSSYVVKVGRTEFITKCVYDATKAMDYIIEHAEELKVDLNKISFMANSAGGAGFNYLAWTYPRLRPGLYTPIAAAVTSEQLDYPVQNQVNTVFTHFVHELGPGGLFSDHFTEEQCAEAVGNPWCVAGRQGLVVAGGLEEYALCNEQYHTQAMNTFCGGAYYTTTFGALESSLVFPTETDHDRGLLYLHLPSQQMRLAQRSDFSLFVKNFGLDPAHHGIYAKRYLDVCREIGISCATYYNTWVNMKETSKGSRQFGAIQYGETFDWHAQLAQAGGSPMSITEGLDFLAVASGL